VAGSVARVLEVDVSNQPTPGCERENILRQTIRHKDIGMSFDEVVAKFLVFSPLQPDEGNLNSNLSSAALIKKAPPAAVDDRWKELTCDLKSVSGSLRCAQEVDGGGLLWYDCVFSYCMQLKKLVVHSINPESCIGEFTVNSAWR
jgi:hypothetical protein